MRRVSPNERISLFLDRVCAHLLWPPYRARVRRELTDHLLTRVEYLQNDRGFNEAEAVELAVRMLGDPDALGRMGARIALQPLVLTVLSAAAMCLAAVITVEAGLGQALDKIIIGNIMLLIPGIALVNSLRDMIVGDTISGLLGACEALLSAIAIAAGCALVLLQLGGAV